MACIERFPFHYFRFLPEGRFLFGGRSLSTDVSPANLLRSQKSLKNAFHRLFPAWCHVECAYSWSGLIAVSRRSVPFIGPLPDPPGVYAALAYQGTGLALAGWSGRAVADRLAGKTVAIPRIMWLPLARYPLPKMRLPSLRLSYFMKTLYHRF